MNGLGLDQNEWHSVTLDDGTRIGIHFYRRTITVHPVIVDARGEETTDTSRWITYVKEEEYDGG